MRPRSVPVRQIVRIFAFAVTLVLCGVCAMDRSNAQPARQFKSPVLIEINDIIDEGTWRYFKRQLQRARTGKADLLVIEIDSPGGLKTVSLSVAEALRDVDWAHTVAYVPRKAISGGALIAMGCNEIVADPQMIFGDIGQIFADPEFAAFRFVPAKIQSVLVRQIRDLAEIKGRPAELAEAMVDKDATVYSRPDEDGVGFQFRLVRVDDPNPPGAPWVLIPETGPERFLTVNGVRAVELGLADGMASSRDALAERFGLEGRQFTVMRYGVADRVVDWLMNPWITLLLVVVGLLALYLELSAPGIGIGAVVAAICTAIFFWSRFFGGTADWLEVILFLGGLAFLGMELFVLPGWGVSGVLGVALFGLSFVMAGQDFVLPHNAYEWNRLLSSLLVLLGAGAIVVVGGVFISRTIGSIPVLNRLVLEPPVAGAANDANGKKRSPDEADKPAAPSHPLVSIGDMGTAATVLRPAGRVRIAGRSVDVVSDGDYIEAGQRVKVVRIQGNMIIVSAVAESRTSEAPVT